MLDAFGWSWFASHLNEIDGPKAPLSVVDVDAGCRGDIRVLKDIAAAGDFENRLAPTRETGGSCSAANLEKAARAVLDYVKTAQ
jgi:hypothetical protein